MSLLISVDVKECVESSCCRMIGWKGGTNDKSAFSIILPLGKRPEVKMWQFLRSIESTTTTQHHYWKKQDLSISGQPSPSHRAFGFFKRQAICRFEKWESVNLRFKPNHLNMSMTSPHHFELRMITLLFLFPKVPNHFTKRRSKSSPRDSLGPKFIPGISSRARCLNNESIQDSDITIASSSSSISTGSDRTSRSTQRHSTAHFSTWHSTLAQICSWVPIRGSKIKSVGAIRHEPSFSQHTQSRGQMNALLNTQNTLNREWTKKDQDTFFT
jgi:hypothetical protein